MADVWISPSLGGLHGSTFETYLRTMSDELDRPIRVMRGRGRQVSENPPAWTTDEAQEANSALDVTTVSERGITINAWAAFSHIEGRSDQTQPDDLMNDGRFGEPVYDILTIENSAFDVIEFQSMMFGEFAARHIVFHWPLTSIPLRNEVRWNLLFDEPLRQCVDEEFLATTEQRIAERAQALYLKIANERSSTEINDRRTRINVMENNLATSQVSIVAMQDELREQQTILDRLLDARRDVSEAELITEWQKLNEHVKVNRVSLAGKILHVFTENIEMTNPNTSETTVVGRFDITLNFETNNTYIRNLTNRRGGYDHPHVNNGRFCQGELEPTIQQLFRERQIGALVNLIIDALGHVTPEDVWGRTVGWFFGDEDAPDPEVTDFEA